MSPRSIGQICAPGDDRGAASGARSSTCGIVLLSAGHRGTRHDTTTPPYRVGIDGLNLALNRGTGVATYARTLARTITGMGRAPDLIFGLPVHKGSPRELRETLFFAELGRDDPADVSAGGSLPKRGRMLVLALAAAPDRGSGRGAGKCEAFADRIPPFSKLYSFGSLWSVAGRHFKRYRRFLTRHHAGPRRQSCIGRTPFQSASRVRSTSIRSTTWCRFGFPTRALRTNALHDRMLRGCVRHGARICTVPKHPAATSSSFSARTATMSSLLSVDRPSPRALSQRDRRPIARAVRSRAPGLFSLLRGGPSPRRMSGG